MNYFNSSFEIQNFANFGSKTYLKVELSVKMLFTIKKVLRNEI